MGLSELSGWRPSRAMPTRGWRLVMAMALLPTAIIGTALLAPERILEHAYGPALERAEMGWTDSADGVPELRLTRLADVKATRKPFIVGDRMVIDSRGAKETIEVIAIEQMDGAGLGLDGMTLQIVTARPPGDATADEVRFLFAVDKPAKLSKPDHAL